MATTEEDLNQLEKDIRLLKIEYEQFFGGGRKRPPADAQWRVELLIKRYGDRSPDMNSGQRFRYSNLTQTYAKYQEMWRKRLKQKEEGTTQRHFGAAAKAIEAERARARTQPPATAFVTALSDAEKEASKVDQLYRKLMEARERVGDEGPAPSFEEFKRFVHRKTQELMQKKGCEQVEYVVSVEGGHVKLKARVRN
jgi:hypothetical protein